VPTASVEALTTRALTLALDAGSMRHRVIATNIANANTPGYQALRVRFEALLDAGTAAAPTPALRTHAEPVQETSWRAGVALDAEAAALAENTVHQQALLRTLQRHLETLATAVSEGRR
jgi:flagellar basal-body rod protein FlgB